MDRLDKRIGWPTFAGLGLVVVAFMVLSLLVTATGTARFAVAMGYQRQCRLRCRHHLRYRQGHTSRGAAGFLARRALGTAALLGAAWICLVVFSCLATHATVSTAISAIERTGTWKMEVRGNTKAELATVEQQLAALSRPSRLDRRRPCARHWPASACRPTSGRTARSAAASRKVSTSRRHAPRSCSCAESWQRLRTTSACQRGPPSCARALRRRRSWRPRIRCLPRSTPLWDASCRSEARKVWRFC